MTEPPVTIAGPRSAPAQSGPSALDARTAVMLIGGFLAVMLFVVMTLLPVNYVVLQPGSVLNTLGSSDGRTLIAISGHPTYPTSGSLDLTTVRLTGGPIRPVTLLQVLVGWLNPHSAVLPSEDEFPPNQTPQQNADENKAEMTDSQQSATAAALATLGIPVPTTLTVAGVDPAAPAAATLKAGDVLLAVNARQITDLQALRTELEALKPGAALQLQVRRNGTAVTLNTRTGGVGDDGHTRLGVYLTPHFSFPFSVKIQIENIGGPSAGMMFALGIIDKLTPGDLTGGKQIAGTGTIDADGTVGPIGGIRQKLIGARQAGARYFLAPATNCDEVRGHVPDGLQVVKTATLAQSRSDVESIAAGHAADLPSC